MDVQISVKLNQITISLNNKTFKSRSRGSYIKAMEAIHFRFFEVQEGSPLAPLDIERINPEAIEKFKFLLLVDFEESRLLPFSQDSLRELSSDTHRRLCKERDEQGFKTKWSDRPESEKFLFFGGGVDSSAVSGMYPQARRVVIDSSLYDTYALRQGDIYVESNLKSRAFQPRGFVFWSQPFAIAPVLAAYYGGDPEFMIGSVLGSSYLQNGRRYFDREKRSNPLFGVTGNMYHSLFNELEIPLYAPLANASEFVSTRVEMLTSTRPEVPAFCQALEGAPCLRCFKCLRKVTERYIISKQLGLQSLPYSDFQAVSSVSQNTPDDKVDFSYFYHIWNYAALRDSSIRHLLCQRGLEMSEDKDLDLSSVYASFERYYQSTKFSFEKLQILSELGVHFASRSSESNLKDYGG